MDATFFVSALEFRAWLEAHHASHSELLVGFWNKASGRGGLTYLESVEQALCFGWIDGVKRKLDANSYTHRFTPRKTTSVWSHTNVRHVERLTTEGRMHAAGLAAFAARDPKKTGLYSFENRPQRLPRAQEAALRANAKAWAYWQQQPPGYQRNAVFWVVSAKQEETRARRLATLIGDCARGKRLDLLTSPAERKKASATAAAKASARGPAAGKRRGSR